ncbi:endolytic transglycosylase MltG [Tenacibaculum finnmarkense genomovar ulcerans]|uniref:endolytic transglycosylase MltG n=1 Tax=Tenacibaculum finnmarkense TaxID=2781243 RepID=UPI00187B4B19|nr:endolytic transglycosylase MltG [Tenacibaculum finnmarkense]MBE7634687.1 endolytic transglycosylase MltG [Tenacibaculum finnmarkense genomovar ulcerans]MBE7646606.1 endolytic transglycosylase MltG [Tenacibaculum finnmarkense genomovar ulcerans]MCD8430801.1 endolytic transglycosylase MltG [Tenacibaculum finnmarkense genomovar ulcerans]
MKKKIIYGIIASIFLIGGFIGFNLYQKIYAKAITKNGAIYIKNTDTFEDVKKQLATYIAKPQHFIWVANIKKFTKPKGGKYQLKKGMNLNNLVNLLRSGNQTPIKLSFNNQDSLEKLAGRIAQQIEADSVSLVNAMTDASFLSENNFNQKNALAMYIPNSYEFYWNTSAEKFRNKILREYKRFWNSSRLEKAKKLNLSKKEVSTLASIVQKETAQKSERPIVAGLYLNRLRDGWPLQADPTVIYCIKQLKGDDFVVKRVLTKDLEIESAYNTYKNTGLPPTLIAMPDVSAIDAVLNYKKHNYYYMCASVTKIGFHDFANSLTQHNRNAVKYQRWISKRGINR